MLSHALEILKYGVRDIKAFPGALAAVFDNGRIYTLSYGTLDGKNNPVTENTIYDIASITKGVATTMGIALLLQKGKIGLAEPLNDYISESRNTPFEDCTIENLLSHTAGFVPVLKMYKSLPKNHIGTDRGKMKMLRVLLASDPLYAPGMKEIYSDLDFFLLGIIIEIVSGQSLDRFISKNILLPLGMDKTFYNPLKSGLPLDIAPTGYCPWRDRQLKGEVNDANTFACGGAGGQAGLFSNALSLIPMMIEIFDGLSDQGMIFDSEMLHLLLDRSDRNIAGSFALGWDTVSEEGTLTGKHFGDKTIGHHGYTGTSLWMETEKKVGIALLTNRVFHDKDKTAINKIRPEFFDAVWEDLGKT